MLLLIQRDKTFTASAEDKTTPKMKKTRKKKCKVKKLFCISLTVREMWCYAFSSTTGWRTAKIPLLSTEAAAADELVVKLRL